MNIKTKIIIALWITSFISINLHSQNKKEWHHEIGINLLQLPSTTIDLSYSITNKPTHSIIVNTGYTVNYTKSFDFIGYILSPHYKCGNNGYSMQNQTGAYLKIGLKYNLRKTLEKNNYFFIGGLLANSLIHEKAEYVDLENSNSQIKELEHTLYVFGLTGLFGYNLKISERIKSDFGIQFSYPSKTYKNLYGYSNYIPGLGYMETCGGARIFPLIFLNLKYELK